MTEVQALTLAEFLLARIAEDEAAAQRDGADAMVGWRWKNYPERAYNEAQALALARSRRVLAECEAKRRITELHAPAYLRKVHAKYGTPVRCEVCEDGLGLEPDSIDHKPLPCPTLRLLALPYADHIDYRQEWRL